MPTPPSLWTDRPDDWDEAADEPVAAGPARGPRPAPASRRGRLTALAAAGLVAVGGGAFALGSQHDAGGSPVASITTAAPSSTPVGKTDVGKVYAKVSGGVVSVRVGQGSGTGFVVDTKGTLVTNDHVVGNAKTAEVAFDDADTLVDATVVGTDPSSDLAVLHVDPAKAGVKLQPLTFAKSARVAVGDEAIAIGYPLGLDRTATAGIISGLGRDIDAPNGYTIKGALQTDAPINPGNSGGPLLNANGEVIGINSQIATSGGSSGNLGIGFAIASDTVTKVVPKLLAGQTVQHAWIGVSIGASAAGQGAQVAEVTDSSPAARAGLRAGDVITALGGTAIDSADAVSSAVAGHAPGDRLQITFTRSGQSHTAEVTLGTRPETAP